ncbi:hypothetical protein [Streptomyces scabiei]|uniref:hypothetical protein n=1 Tax=Streptomyces scabiei TaxID=1930 RepID=UPI0038F6A84E
MTPRLRALLAATALTLAATTTAVLTEPAATPADTAWGAPATAGIDDTAWGTPGTPPDTTLPVTPLDTAWG